MAFGGIALATIGASFAAVDPPDAQTASSERARSIHCAALTIDSHIDVPNNFATAEVDPGTDGEAQLTLPKMQRGCLDAAFFIAAVGQNERTAAQYRHAWDEAQKMIAGIHRMTKQYPQRIALARTADDVVRITNTGRQAALIGLENGYALGTDLRQLRALFDLGVRYITLTHVGHNAFADSSVPIKELGDAQEEHGGLSEIGRELIQEMNCLGIMVDVSHTSKKTTLQAIGASKTPVIASHSAARGVANSPRNMDDEQLRLLAQHGGVIQVVGYSHYIKLNSPEKERAIDKVSTELGLSGSLAWAQAPNSTLVAYGHRLVALDQQWPRASVADYVDHIDYIVKRAGIDHVGVGSDFYAGGGAASGGLNGWMDVSQNVHVTEELLRRGYSEQDIRKIWGGNLLRVMRETQKAAASCRRDRQQ
jgi:membrane dipeptidase